MHIPFVGIVKFKFLAHFPEDYLATQSWLALYSFCANLLHSLIMWLIVSSLSPQSLHLLFCCVLSILALIWLVLMALFCAAIRRDSVSLLKFPFLTQVQVLLCEMLFISRLKRMYCKRCHRNNLLTTFVCIIWSIVSKYTSAENYRLKKDVTERKYW